MKNTSKSLKRLLSMVMVLAMILAMLPMSAFAASTSVTVAGAFNSWSTTANPLTLVSGNIYSTTIELSAGTYEFKIVKDGTWMGNGGTITDTTATTSDTGWEMSSSNGSNCKLTATGGTYAFTYNISNNMLIVTRLNDISLRGSFNEWSDAADMMQAAEGTTVSCTKELAAGTYTFKVYNGGAWMGNGSTTSDSTTSQTLSNSGGDCTLTATGGIYTFTYNYATRALSITHTEVYDVTFNGTNVTSDGSATVAEGSTYSATLTASEGYDLPETVTVTIGGAAYTGFTFENGILTIPGEAVTGDIVITAEGVEQVSYLYLKPNSNWRVDNARFAAYFFGNGEKWVSMTDSDGDGYYEVEIPEGYTSVIFCRMNPSSITNGWTANTQLWNQTNDLTIPNDGSNCYTVAEGAWSYGDGTWSTYTPSAGGNEGSGEGGGETTTTDYYLVGYINNADYNGQDYKFVDGKLTVTFANDSYVVVKDGSGDWYLCESYCTDTTATLTKGNSEKMFVAAGTEWTFTLVENADGTLTLSYAKSEAGGEETDDVEYEVTFHFANTVGWGTVNLYTWTQGGANPSGGWPGSAISQDADGFYSATVTYTAPAGQGLNFIFNNGGTQTVDLSIPASEFVDNRAEKWVILTTQTDGKYNADILDEAFRLVISPVVDGTSVTFNYENSNATSVSLRGSMNDWGETAMEKDADGIWTVTLTDLEPGVYEYKFFVDGEWITDPTNSWIEGDNSAFIILDPNAEDTNSITVNIHYSRPNGDYEGWNMWIWNEDGNIEDTSALVGDELVATLVFEDARAVQSVSVIPRLSTEDNEWAAEETTYTIDLSNIVSGTVDYYITSGNSNGRRGLNTDVVLGNKLSAVELDYDTGKIHVTIAKPVADAAFDVANVEYRTIYFQNNWLWTNVSIYYWGNAGTNPSWPGVVMTLVGNDGTNDIYAAQIPVDATGFIINGVKNDGSGNRDQSPDLAFSEENGLCYYMEWDNGNRCGTFTYENAFRVTETTGSGAQYTLTLSEELNLVTLYQYKVIFEGYEYDIDIDAAYASDKFAEEYTYEGTDLGAIISEDKTSTTFRVWAPTAEAVSVNLYTSGTKGTDDLIESVPMTAGANGTWTVTVDKDLNGVYYTYSVTRDGETIEAVDPYARTTGVNGKRGMVIDLDSTDPEGWDEDKNPNPSTSYTDAIIYELHVRDFSIDSSSGIIEDYQGKFLAFTQSGTTVNGEDNGLATGIDYLKSLGVTHVHLLPVYDYGSVDETTCSNFNWGYDPVNYNVPEGSYSTDPYKGEVRVKEFKLMVQALHEAGISVIMDVVYNHVYDADKFGFNQIVPGYFSRVDSNASGCGNDTASEREMVRKYIVESVNYWSSEYHIDGFRFDLVGLIDVETINQIVETVHETRPDTIFYGEGWNMDSTNSEEDTEMAKQGNADITPGFAYFSDSIRDQIAGSNGSSLGFVSGGGIGGLMAYFLAQPESWGETWTNNPSQVVQYVSCHDNYTLMDKLIISTGALGITDDIISMNNLSAAIYMTAQGIPFIHAGEEMLREKINADGSRNHNSYNSTDAVNSIKWDNLLTEEYADTVAYYQGLIAFRKAHDALRMNNAADVAANVQGVKLGDNLVAFLFDGNAADDDDILVIFNAGGDTVVKLPEGIWNVCVDGDDAGTDTLYTAQTAVQVSGISAMILTRADTGENEDQTGSGSSSDTITLYFSNNKYWSNVYAHYWGGTTGTEWPGAAMIYVETNDYGEAIYSVTVPANTTGLVFHNNAGAQTADIIPGADGTGYYCTDANGEGKFEVGTYTYGSSGGAAVGGFTNDGVYEGESQYFLFGWINGEDYACNAYYEAMGKYQFVDGKLTVLFENDSYVGIKTTGNATWYMTDGWLGNVTSTTLYDSNGLGENANKLMIPGGVEVTFTLTENEDGTLTLTYEAVNNGPVDGTGIQNGATLHCWNWSFAEIEANMAKIAEMGFTAIQTSPIQPLKEFTTDETDTVSGCWWLYYQPTGFVITDGEGNALGTKAELEKMIATAHEYGIQVIVDVVANHLANETDNVLSSAIPEYLLAENYWHNIKVNTSNYDSRYDVTQHCMGGLPDLNTGNGDIQQFVLDFLKQCIDLGVDGFRFDGAKHIETPDDELYFESDFWPFVIGGAESYASETYGKDIYVYGEVLDGTNGYSISDYTEFMAVTDNSWGNTLRENVAAGNAALVPGYDKATDASNLVIWAESHDTYADGTSSGVSQENINKVWALIAARADAMGLYFARPESNEQLLGVGSVTGWYSDVVKIVNRFHTAYAGESEVLGNAGGISYVVRGDSGIVLVNVEGNEAQVKLSVPMADGTYLDRLTRNVFTVENGVISGTIGETGVVVAYDSAKGHEPGAPADCVNNQICTICGIVLDTAKGHSYEAVITEPTCGAEGYTTYTCHCGDSYVADEVPATGEHTFGAWQTLKAAGCTVSGLRTRECVCGASQPEVTPATGIHTYGDWSETKAPTCTASGEKTRTCDCGDVQTAAVAALGHTEVVDAAVPATCAAAGKTQGKHCSVCNEVLVAQEVIEAKPHSVAVMKAVEATCTTAGLTEGTYCPGCGLVFAAQEEFPATGHSFGDWFVSVEATRQEAGQEKRICANCGEIETREIQMVPTSDSGVGTVVIAVIVVIVLGAGAAAAFIFLKKKRA